MSTTAQPPTKPDRQWSSPRVIFTGLCAVIATAPLPFGSARPLAWDIAGLAIALLMAMSLARIMEDEYIFRKHLLVPSLVFAAVAAFVIFQIFSFVPAVWQNPVWDLASGALGRDVAGSIAVDRQAAYVGLYRLLSYAGIFYLAMILCRKQSRARAAVELVMVSGSLYAAYGLLVYWSGNKTILWFSKWTYVQDLSGTFVNKNSFATYLGLCTLAALTHLILSFQQLRLHGDWRNKIGLVLDFISRRATILVSIFVLTTALFLTHSRGGLLSTFAGILALALAMAMAPSLGRMRQLRWILLPLVMIFIALAISGDVTFERLIGTDLDTENRISVYQLTLQAIRDYPWLGTGLGSFTSVFPIYRSPDVKAYFDLAHNDYLQNGLELGIPAALGLLAVLAWLAVICARGLRQRRRDAVFPCLGVAATVLVALHATVDFGLQIPAVTYTFCFLLGVAVSQSWSSRVSADKIPNDAEQRLSGKPGSAPDRRSTQT